MEDDNRASSQGYCEEIVRCLQSIIIRDRHSVGQAMGRDDEGAGRQMSFGTGCAGARDSKEELQS